MSLIFLCVTEGAADGWMCHCYSFCCIWSRWPLFISKMFYVISVPSDIHVGYSLHVTLLIPYRYGVIWICRPAGVPV